MSEYLAPIPVVLMDPAIRRALEEDLGRGGDITTNATIPAEAQATVVMAAREEGIAAGLDVATRVFEIVDPALGITRVTQDGQDIKKGSVLLEVSGSARSILMAERVALNFVTHMSGIATLTQKMVRAVGNHKARICSTRKTLPGLRLFETYAVRAGGGVNHRLGLDDAVLIKDNHIAVAGGVALSIMRAKQSVGHMVKIEVEVDTLKQLEEALSVGVDAVLLDNMPPDMLAKAVKMVDGRAVTEASGGVRLEKVPAIAASGVDMISVGALTHSAPSLDVGLDFKVAA